MPLKDKLIREDTLTQRKHLGSLGWIIVLITLTFGLAGALGAYRLVTHNISRLNDGATPVPQVNALANGMTLTPDERAGSPVTATATVTASQGITWTVWASRDSLGQTIYDGPSEVKQWAIRDYENTQKWMLDHLFEKDYLLAHLGEYFSGNALDMERGSIEESFAKTHLVWAPLVAQPRQPAPLNKPAFETFSADGWQLNLSDYTDSGNWKQYDTRTRKLSTTKAHKFLWAYTLEYDPMAKRWKIARLRMIYDIDSNRPAYTNEP